MDELNEDRMEESYNEGELSDDEFEELSSDDLFDWVEINDPILSNMKLNHLILASMEEDEDDFKESLATAIGRNTQLKALMFDGWEINRAQAMNLFSDIACNQSIKRFYFNNCGEHLGHICHILTPLFKNNQVERIRIYNCNLSFDSTRSLAISLTKFGSLKEFALANAIMFQHVPQEVARDLMQALSGHSALRKLDLTNTNVGKLGCSALVDLLSNLNTNLRVLDLASNNLGDAGAVALASGIAGNASLKEINLARNNGIGQAGWQALFDALSNSSCRLEMIKLEDNKINDAAAQSLSNALASSTTLKTLKLGYNGSITVTGWCVLFGFLRSPNCALENLNLSSNLLNDEAMTSLADVLQSNRLLKSLNLSSNSAVTGAAWQTFFSAVLANPRLGLEKLFLGYNSIHDAAIGVLTNSLVNNSKLKALYLSGNNQVTSAGWEMFSSVLESPNMAVEELHLFENEISDATCTELLNSLVNNKKLKKLVFDHSADWAPPLSVLCNSDNIMRTYNSNHILEELGDQDGLLPEERQDDLLPAEFESLLKINRENSPSQAARLKIIKTHFNEGFIAQPFLDMDLNVLPHAIAWMSRGCRAGVSGHFYEFIKSISSLFENEPDKGNKRKRND